MFMQYLTQRRKLRVERPVYWDHHRGGWKDVVELITDQLHCPDGVRVVSAVEDTILSGEVIREPWVGFVHEVPWHTRRYPDLERLLNIDTWKANVGQCRGLWVLSTYYKRYLQSRKVPFPVNFVYYPTEIPKYMFSFRRFINSQRKKLLFIGEYLRVFEAFYDLIAPGYDKILLRCLPNDADEGDFNQIQAVTVMDHVSNDDYDRLLEESIVFLNLSDAGANTTIVECIARTTPILVNKVGGVSEYLGESYPFYYDSLEEASLKIQDLDLIASTVQYLRRWHVRYKITFDNFLASLQNTAIYRSLPLPRSQQTIFKTFDVTIVICSYKRVHDLEELMQRFSQQDFTGTFEILLWNNNIDASSEVQNICQKYEKNMNIKVIHSSENFYCIIRLAVTSLMRSDLLLICDDDVMPNHDYISTFLKKYQEYGPNVVLCARGNVFLPHVMNEEHPEVTWATGDHIVFYDESEEDRQIHFMHADNCLIPKRILREILQFNMERYEFTLVDDYWLSFIISHRIKVPIWKIKADHSFTFSQASEDQAVAMFYNDLVCEQKINFYVYHMRQGWPPEIFIEE